MHLALPDDRTDAIRRAESDHLLELSMPAFEFRSQLQLKPALQELGMVPAFTDPALPDGADFTGEGRGCSAGPHRRG